jgi:UDP-N-acetylglucosamine enolpyruvyl transferase
MQAMGAVIKEKYGYISAQAEKLTGADIHLDRPL